MRYFFAYFMALLSSSVGLSFAVLPPAGAAQEYRVTAVGPPGSRAAGINNAGVVVGYYPANGASPRAFLSRGSGWVDLTVPGIASAAVAINDRGKVLGRAQAADGQWHSVIWHRGGQQIIAPVPGAAGTRYIAINNAGYTVAQAVVDNEERSFLRTPAGTFQDLGALATVEPITDAHAINNRNQVTGASGEFLLPEIPFRAFHWSRGVLRDLGDFGSTPNEGNDINDCGQITGYLAVPTGGAHARVAFIYTNGRLQDIDGRPASADRYSQGQGINNHGHAVGDSDHLRGWVYRGRRMQSLNALIDPASGWDIQLPRDINDAGQIAATGTRNGQYYAVRLDLIRPHLETLPERALDEEDALNAIDPPLAPEQVAEEARLDAQAEAREVVQPVLL